MLKSSWNENACLSGYESKTRGGNILYQLQSQTKKNNSSLFLG